jgi:hypothetical protein
MSVASSIEATRELCADLDNLIELTKERRAPIRALSVIERARADLQAYLDEIERTSSTPRTWSSLGAEGEEMRAARLKELEEMAAKLLETCPYRKSNPAILMVQSAQDRMADNPSSCLSGA